MAEKTLVLLKPDAVARGLTGEIIGRLETKGLRLAAMKMIWMDEALAKRIDLPHKLLYSVYAARWPHRLPAGIRPVLKSLAGRVETGDPQPGNPSIRAADGSVYVIGGPLAGELYSMRNSYVSLQGYLIVPAKSTGLAPVVAAFRYEELPRTEMSGRIYVAGSEPLTFLAFQSSQGKVFALTSNLRRDLRQFVGYRISVTGYELGDWPPYGKALEVESYTVLDK